jgi:alkylation response protein AidB-like acyl-CoA dehydrogenase
VQTLVYLQELAARGIPRSVHFPGYAIVAPSLLEFGDKNQRELAPAAIRGDDVWCIGMSEPNAGSDLAGLQTDARLDGDHYIVNGQKVWTSYGWAADWCELVVRTDPSVPKHKGLTVLLVDMKTPGIEVRPLRQMTGETEFNEVFFRDVRVPVANVVGAVNRGWDVAIGTLMHERGTFGAGLQITYKRNMNRLIELSRTLQRNGRPAAEDPVIRQKLAQCYTEVEVMRANQMRAFSRISATGVPGPEGSIQKIFWSELNQRLQQIAQELLGPYGQLAGGDARAIDHGQWAYGYLRARGNTIEAGTSEIQRNIIGHFVLGLPRSY